MREALFDVLTHATGAGAIEGARVLDLYAGSGALGIEALSRGALSATFVEQSAAALRVLRANLRSLALAERTFLRRGEVRSFLQRTRPLALADSPSEHPPLGRPWSLVFLDPPYAQGEAAKHEMLHLLGMHPALSLGAWVVLEADARRQRFVPVGSAASPGGAPPATIHTTTQLAHRQTRTYGDTALHFFQKTCSSKDSLACLDLSANRAADRV